MNTLNARVGRTRPSPARLRLAGQPHQAGHQEKRSITKSLYVGALLVAGVLLLLGGSILSWVFLPATGR